MNFYQNILIRLNSDIKHYGTIQDSDILSFNENDQTIINKIREICDLTNTHDCNIRQDKPVLQFPTVSKEPEDEYDGIPIFSNAFPWLFPGGIGDINRNKKMSTDTFRSGLQRWFIILTVVLFETVHGVFMH